MKNSRNTYFDFLRGLAILMVVGIHTFRGGNFDSLQGWVVVSLRQVLNSAVPIFLAISGFFLARKDLRKHKETLAFWSYQIPKVYIPVLIWGIPWLILKFIGHSSIIISIISWAFCGLSIFYFVALIIQYYLLLPLIQKVAPPTTQIGQSEKELSNRRQFVLVVISSVVSIISVLFVTWVRFYKGVELPLIVYAGPFPLWLIFFVMGVALAHASRDYKLTGIVVLLLISLVLQVIEARYLNHILGISGYGIKASSFLFSAMMIMLMFSRKVECALVGNGRLFRVFKWVGSISFGIYLSHCLWVIIIAHFFPIGNWLLAWIVVFCSDVMFIMILKKLVPQRYSVYFGL